jgi:exosortase
VHALWIVPLLLLSAPTLGFLWQKWTVSIWDNGHGIFVPLLVVLLAWRALRREPVESEEPSLWGFAVVVPSLCLVALDSAIRTELLAAFALLAMLPGLSLLLLGVRRTRALAFPLALCFLMLPIPAALMSPLHGLLQQITTDGTAWVLQSLRMPVFAEGMMLYLPHGTLQVVEGCSGWSALYAAVTVSLVLAHLSASWAGRAVILASAFPLAIACNVSRVSALAILAERMGYEILATPVHVFSGYASFLLTLMLIFVLADRFVR